MTQIDKEEEIRKEWQEFCESTESFDVEYHSENMADFWIDKLHSLQQEKTLDPELKQCPSCHTMKLFSTNICYRCLDRAEARREIEQEIEEEIKKLETCGMPDTKDHFVYLRKVDVLKIISGNKE